LPFINIFILLGHIRPRQKSDGRMSPNNIKMFTKRQKRVFIKPRSWKVFLNTFFTYAMFAAVEKYVYPMAVLCLNEWIYRHTF